MYKTYRIIIKPLDFICITVVYFYKKCISPLKPKTCKFTPTCSTYMLYCIKEYGSIKGIMLGLKRLFRCNPKCTGGYDFIPPNLKGDIKWIV